MTDVEITSESVKPNGSNAGSIGGSSGAQLPTAPEQGNAPTGITRAFGGATHTLGNALALSNGTASSAIAQAEEVIATGNMAEADALPFAANTTSDANESVAAQLWWLWIVLIAAGIAVVAVVVYKKKETAKNRI